MFHQANVIPTELTGGSLLGYWFEQVLALFSQYIAFPVTVRDDFTPRYKRTLCQANREYARLKMEHDFLVFLLFSARA